jgi:protease-4
MNLDADALVDRRRLSRRASFWRVVAFIAALAAIFLAAALISEDMDLFGRDTHLARISIDGLITDDRRQQDLIERASRDARVKALILAINSPGGTTSGSEAYYQAIRDAAGRKPVVAALGTLAASGGYIVAIAADRVFARGNTVTGSIGVVFQWAQVREALEKLGVQVEEVKSAPLKAEPSPFTETSEEARAVMREMVADSYRWFLDLVAERRKLDAGEARRLGDGRVYTGRQALGAGLIDEIGGESEAIGWLSREYGIDPKIKVRDWEAEGEIGTFGLLDRMAVRLARLFGFDPSQAMRLMGEFDAAQRLRLDGLVSVWHAPLEKVD